MIKSIVIEELFGFYNYHINTNSELEGTLILYGDNGSGKTTILKSIFYLISSKSNAGHKSALARIKFKRIEVTLTNGVSIGASRENDLIGSYNYYIRNNESIILQQFLIAQHELEDYVIRIQENKEAETDFFKILSYLKSLNLKIFYLSDNRQTMDVDVPVWYKRSSVDGIDFDLEIVPDEIKRKPKKESRPDLIDNNITMLENWIKSRVLSTAKLGEKKANNIYLDIVNKIKQTDLTTSDDIQKVIADFQSLINQVKSRINAFVELGLMNKAEYSQMETAFLSVEDNKKMIIYDVLEPFIRGILARLDAQEKIQVLLTTILSEINSYLYNKTLSYNLQTGFRVTQSLTNERIQFNYLSSGEKQLILLFCNTILASNQAKILIIDEPEISLNIKWQRNLLNSLLKLNAVGKAQFLLATHSFEILSSHREQVIKLTNLKGY